MSAKAGRPKRTCGRGRRYLRRGLAVGVVTLVGVVAGASAFAAFGGFDPGKLDLSPQMRRHIEQIQQKNAILGQDLRPKDGPVLPPAKNPWYRPPAERPRKPVLAGRVQRYQDGGVPLPFPGQMFACTTFWKDLRGRTDLAIYTGYRPTDPQQGVLIVQRTDGVSGSDQPGGGDFATPQKVGALTLTSVVGNVVSFTFPGGRGTFDLATHRFLMPAA